MSARLFLHREQCVGVLTIAGSIATGEVSRLLETFDIGEFDHIRRLISYFHASADLSGVALDELVDIKRVWRAKLNAGLGRRRFVSALVCDSRVNMPIVSLWRSFAAQDPDHPVDPMQFETLKAAFDWLDLSAGARGLVQADIDLALSQDLRAEFAPASAGPA